MLFIILSMMLLFGFGFAFGIQGNEMIICGLLVIVIISFIKKLISEASGLWKF